MLFSDIVAVGNVIALSSLTLLLLANIGIIVDRLWGRGELARWIIKRFEPIARLFRMGNYRNPPMGQNHV